MLSVCLITKNEEKVLAGCLESIKDIADEIVIVDSYSDDNTLNIAKQYNAKIISAEFHQDFSEMRNLAMRSANGQWLLNMDADERLDSRSKAKLRTLIAETQELHYSIWNYTYLPNGGFNIPAVTRLIQNRADIYWRRPVHETLNSSLTRLLGNEFKRNLTDIIIHHLHLNRSNLESTAQWYADIFQQKLEKDPNDWYSLRNLGMQYADANQFERAIEACEAAVQLKPEFARNHFYLGCIYFGAKAFSSALNSFCMACKLDPEDVNVQAMSAIVHYTLGNYEEATQIWLNLKHWYPHLVHSSINLGIFWELQGKWELALEMFQDAYTENQFMLTNLPLPSQSASANRYFTETLPQFEGLVIHLVRCAKRIGKYDLADDYLAKSYNFGLKHIYKL